MFDFQEFLLNKEKNEKNGNFLMPFLHFVNFFLYYIKISQKSKIILYKRGKGARQTFPMPSQDDCLKLLHKRKN